MNSIDIQSRRISIIGELLGRKRVSVFFVVFALEIAILTIATTIPIGQLKQSQLLEEGRRMAEVVMQSSFFDGTLFIFYHNLTVALLEIIPVVGVIIFLYSIYITGQVIQAISLSHNVPGTVAGYLLLFFPYSVIELSAYSIAVTSGIMLLISLRRGKFSNELKVLPFEVLGVIFTLMLAALFEEVTIRSPIVGLSLWIPSILVFLYVIKLVKERW